MYIKWFGQSAFKITIKNQNDEEINILTDPFAKEIGLHMPKVDANIVTISHDHADHSNLDAVKNEQAFIIKSPGEYEVSGVLITGVQSYHDKANGAERGLNIIYKINAEELSVAHLGDVGHVLTDEQLEVVEGVDILLLPIGGRYTINAKEAAEIVAQVEPRIVIPMHYKIPGLKIDLEGLSKFAEEMGCKPNGVLDKFKVTKKDLLEEDVKVVILGV